MICIICKEKIEKDQKRFMLAFDNPYFNLWFHRNCFWLNKNNINQILKDEFELIAKIFKLSNFVQ